MEKLNFHIITPYFGPQEWLKECISSVKAQSLSSCHHVIIDTERKGACRNHFETLQNIDPVSSNIIVHLDGDDMLIGFKVLEVLQSVYQNNDIWATYGNYVSRQGSVCRPIDQRSFRESIVNGGWPWSHLRTFRAHLIPYLKENDMKDSQGNWFSSAPDVAIFLPVLEMCGKNRVKFINKDLVYYRVHESNEHSDVSRLRDQVRCAIELSKKKEYTILP